jgi:lysozyme family protein
MADFKHIIPFIRRAEGGWVNDPLDAGGETNSGIIYSVWTSVFGTDAHDRFMAMSDADWGIIYKKLYWDQTLGDQIQSQRIADIIVDWVWGSGKHYPEIDIQDILIHSFGAHIGEDGDFGPATIAAINATDEQQLWDAIVAKRFWFLDQCVVAHPTNARFLQGWKNRMNHLITFETTGQLV